jgi:hypothetical protein
MLKLTSLITPSAMLAAFALAAAPSFAQERYHGRDKPSGQESGGQRVERAQPRSETPHSETPRAQADAPRTQGAAPRVESRQETPRAQQPRQTETPRVENRRDESRRDEGRSDSRRSESRRGDSRQGDNRRDEAGRAVPRRDVIVPRGSYSPRYEPRYSPRYSPRVYAPRSYYRPYEFRPRFSIGFGIFAGYPVPYTYSYPYPIMVYGYRAPRERVMITPGSSYYGGVALEITPDDADVFVDGEYAGRVEDFDGTTQPLTLTAGTHRIEVRAPGYEPLAIDIGVQPGQVIPYRGDLRPY